MTRTTLDGVLIRRATADQDVALSDLARVCGLTLHPSAERALDHARLHVACTAEDGSDVSGFALIWLLGDQAEIVDLGVAPAARRRGLGRLLLETSMRCAASAGIPRVFLEVRAGNAPARALYEAAGFENYGRRNAYYSDGEDAILYRCCTSSLP